jgi:hypothetical protein
MFTIGFDGTFTVGDRTFAGTGGRSMDQGRQRYTLRRADDPPITVKS